MEITPELKKEFNRIGKKIYSCMYFINDNHKYVTTIPSEIANNYATYMAHGRGPRLQKYIIRFGEEVGREKWKVYCEKMSYKNTFEYKNKKYGMTQEEFKSFNNSRAITLVNLVKKYGEIEGTLKYNSYCDKQAYSNTLEYFIEKHGKEEGTFKYNRYCRDKAHTYENYIKWYGEEGEAKFKEHIQFKSPSHASKSSQKFFKKLYNELSEHDKISCYYHDKNCEYGIMNELNKKYCKYDFCLTSKKIIIEYNGDHVHANPTIYSPDDIPKYFRTKTPKTAQEVWDADAIKKKIAEGNGFSVYYVWQSENEEQAIKKILEIINEH